MNYVLKLLLMVAPIIFIVSCSNVEETPLPTVDIPNTTSVTAIFDFDKGSPLLTPGQNTPLEQISDGLAARFSSPSDPAAFSIQTGTTTFLKFSQFSGNFLYDNSAMRKNLNISFSQLLNSITLTFATTDSHGPGNVDEPSCIELTAYVDSTETTPIGSVTACGTFNSDSFPQGILTFTSSEQPFNVVVIRLIPQPRGGPSFFLDNISTLISVQK